MCYFFMTPWHASSITQHTIQISIFISSRTVCHLLIKTRPPCLEESHTKTYGGKKWETNISSRSTILAIPKWSSPLVFLHIHFLSFRALPPCQGQRLQKEEPIALERLVAVDWWDLGGLGIAIAPPKRKYIWTNHWFSRDMVVFRGVRDWKPWRLRNLRRDSLGGFIGDRWIPKIWSFGTQIWSFGTQWKGIIRSMVLLIGEVGSFQWVLDFSVFSQGGFHDMFSGRHFDRTDCVEFWRHYIKCRHNINQSGISSWVLDAGLSEVLIFNIM